MKVNLPIVGKATGSSAGLIYQSYWGSTYTRSFPFSFHYPDTKKQQECQASFFDIQRVWLSFYPKIMVNINKSQKRNRNPFNALSAAIYKVLNPYVKPNYKNPPQSFGLDTSSLMHMQVNVDAFNFADGNIRIGVSFMRPHNSTGFQITKLHCILFNRTSQSMYYKNIELDHQVNTIYFENTQDWKEDDEILFYTAISADNWLGNFYRSQL